MAASGQSSRSVTQGMEEAGKLLERLNLQDEEVDDLVWEDKIDVEEIKPKWLALGWLLTGKNFNQNALMGDMKAAWNPAQEVTWRRINANLFSIQFNCLGDWNKAMHQGPWDFHGIALILAEYDGFSNPEKVKLDRLETWCQIHKLPDGVLRSKSALENLARRIGKVQEVQVTLLNGFIGEFIRIRVKLDVNRKLTRAVGITKGGGMEKYLVKFEKLPTFCNACGLLGHWHEECGTGEHDETKFEWGCFLLASRRGRGGSRGGRGTGYRQRNEDDEFSGRGRGFGRGPGRGRGNDAQQNHAAEFNYNSGGAAPVIWRHNYVFNETVAQGQKKEGELAHASESQDVRVAAGPDNILGKRVAEDNNSTATVEVIAGDKPDPRTALVPFVRSQVDKSLESATVAEKVNMFEGEMDEDALNPMHSGTPQKNANREKLRGIDGQAVDSNTSIPHELGSATPFEGDRREQ